MKPVSHPCSRHVDKHGILDSCHCGERPEFINDGRHSIRCPGCNHRRHSFDTRIEAITDWNIQIRSAKTRRQQK